MTVAILRVNRSFMAQTIVFRLLISITYQWVSLDIERERYN